MNIEICIHACIHMQTCIYNVTQTIHAKQHIPTYTLYTNTYTLTYKAIHTYMRTVNYAVHADINRPHKCKTVLIYGIVAYLNSRAVDFNATETREIHGRSCCVVK